MKSIKAKEVFSLNDVDYFVEVKTKDITEIIKLNEQGFIEPLSRKEITLIQRELTNKESEEE
jgi:hypothetical protein